MLRYLSDTDIITRLAAKIIEPKNAHYTEDPIRTLPFIQTRLSQCSPNIVMSTQWSLTSMSKDSRSRFSMINELRNLLSVWFLCMVMGLTGSKA